MGFRARMDGHRAYQQHVAGNRLYDGRRFQEAQEKFNRALELYQQAVEGGCTDVRVLMAYGVLLLKQRRFDQAHELMLKTEKMPGITSAEKKQLRINYAVCEWKRGRLDRAIELMEQAAQDGVNSMIYGSLGYMLIEKARQTGDFSKAEAFNAQAYEYDDEDPVTLDNLGQLALAQGKREEALDYFRRAIQQKPTQVDTLYFLAKLAHEDGEDEQARSYLETALENPFTALCTTTREQAQALLEQLGR